MNGRISVVHGGRLELVIIRGSSISLRDRYENVGIVTNVIPSQNYEISSAFGTIKKRDGDHLVGSTSAGQRDRCSVFSVSLELEQRKVREEHTSLAGDDNESKVRVKTVEKNLNERLINRMTLPLELKRSKEEVERLWCENELLWQTA